MPQFEPEQRFGKYRIIRFLGRGSMGVVYLAEDETLGREVALKILDRNVVVGSEFEVRFRQEAKTVARLQHPNIVPIHALECIDGELAIDMAFLEGGPLSAQSASIEQCVKWAGDVLEALETCHASGIVHRDVKPSNILLSLGGRALLSDFGLAKLLAVQHSMQVRSTSSSCMFVGTPRYAPPEAWDGEEPSPAWDVYSMGMVLYEMAAGKLPYDAETPLALLKQMIATPIPPLREVTARVSPELSEAVARMIASDPRQRPSDAGEAMKQLQRTPECGRVASAPGSTMVPKQQHEKPPRWQRARRVWAKRRLMHWKAVAMIVVVIAVTALVSWGAAKQAGLGMTAADPIDLASANVFDGIDPFGPEVWQDLWLMERTEGIRSWRILASAASRVWRLDARRLENGAFAFTGDWAEYSDPAARLFRYGDCTGAGRLDRERSEFAVTLTFRDALSGNKSTRALLLRPSANASTPADFLSKLETADYVPALLYTELRARNVPWLNEIEEVWLSRAARIVTAPIRNELKPPAVIDGVLQEPMWQSALVENKQDLGELPSEGSAKAQLMVRYSEEALYVGIRGEGIAPESVAEIAVLPLFDIRTAESPRWMARIQGSGIVNALHVRRQEHIPWKCDWQGAIEQGGGAWNAEVRIPFAGLGLAGAATEGQRWRLNCHIRLGGDADSAPLAYWGDPVLLNAERGVVLRYGSLDLGR